MMRQRHTASLTLLDKVNVCLQAFGDHVMHLVFDVQGQINLERLQRAARLSLVQHPIMAMQLQESGLQPRWQAHPEHVLDAFRYCDLIEESECQPALDRFLVQERDYRIEPMLKIRVIRHTVDTVCIKVSCVPIDGRGFLIFVEDLLAIYEHLQLNPNYQPPAGNLDLRSTKALLPYFKVIDVFRLLISGLRNQITDSRTANNWQFPSQPGQHIEKRYYCHQCRPSTLQALNRYRKLHDLSFNDVLLGAYYKALYEIIQPSGKGPYCVLNTYDLRRYEQAGAPNRVANYSSFINTNVRLQADTSLAAAARAVSHAINTRKARYPGITEGPFIWPLLTFLPFPIGSFIVKGLLKHRGEKIPVFTNVGVIHTDKMRINGQPISNVQPFAPLEHPPKLTVTLATSGEVISLSVGYSENHFPTTLIQHLFQRMEQLIRETCIQPNTVAA
ncbi:MAG: hypothetical protein ACPGZU_01930 [Ketobacter sp.]|jgi:NRPS condensation-like uncharacterized protein|uniref:hypothetical protein n=1 Tax=unclassified Ketobacter TaxID=2639109 RepID=UPI000E8508E6|nr:MULTISPECIES: hypothetical protein [unclassified Ketobacter]MEC8812380.1 hypothetical protein [Pseudomonadota bacterium]HAG96704.1 hypothetical protein [Gammaproteobacteria bacterium]RLT90733.1 MAG: hypothetical protein D9N13_08270 [Ketobacter sp. GenoA1]RLT92021.1 MAG: hypothetical protein D9N15_23050 [Ketobacter sp.]HAU12066.1 hypothetical protein [Gammaproteobacteria bacterium]|tara:strand:- start:582 stop:1916 length:1335 start_codon:yes stop_codon:yes gene_type:complete